MSWKNTYLLPSGAETAANEESLRIPCWKAIGRLFAVHNSHLINGEEAYLDEVEAGGIGGIVEALLVVTLIPTPIPIAIIASTPKIMPIYILLCPYSLLIYGREVLLPP